MRFFGLLFAGLLGLSATLSSATAQQKMAHVNSQEILSELPDVQQAQKKLETFSQSLDKQFQALQNEYLTKLDKYESESAAMAESVKKSKEQELSDLQRRIQNFQQQAQADVQKKRQELLQPILDRVNNTIQEVARKNGYNYVLDRSTGAVVYADDSYDITPKVKAALGIN